MDLRVTIQRVFLHALDSVASLVEELIKKNSKRMDMRH